MDRFFQKRSPETIGRRTSETLRCDRCGRPMKAIRDQDTHEEILCPCCASEARASDALDDE